MNPTTITNLNFPIDEKLNDRLKRLAKKERKFIKHLVPELLDEILSIKEKEKEGDMKHE